MATFLFQCLNMHADKKIILFFPFNLLSHYLRCLVLADSYDKNEYKIYFLSAGDYNFFVLQHGYETFDCQQFDPQFVMQCSEKFNFSWLNQRDLNQILLAQVAVIKTLKAAVVIGDVAPTLKMAAALTGTHHISLLNGYMTRYYACTRKISKSHPAYSFTTVLPKPLAGLLTRAGENLAFKKVQQAFNAIRRKYGLQILPHYLYEIEGAENLICDLPELFPQKNLPANFKFVGPLVYHFHDQDQTWINQFPKDRPVICVSMGSTGDWNKLRFLNDPYYSRYTLVTAGDKKRILSADHIISKDFVNLNELLKRADLMICHGGNGTLYQGMLSHVHMLCLSSNFEQEWNIHAFAEKGYATSADNFNEAKWKLHIAACCTYSGNQLVKDP
jgi:UDP:flavonoid glycosyltransferase YjiC (YdhE family)